MIDTNTIFNTTIHQLNNFWTEIDSDKIKECIVDAIADVAEGIKCLELRRVNNDGNIIINPLHSVTWSVFLYRLSRRLYLRNYITEADEVYYLNKIMHSVDWFYQTELPDCFFAEHPLGSVMGKAKYGNRFFVYQGTTVGGNWKDGNLSYPVIGDNVIMYANSTILGDARIGNNVIISANTYIMNENVPDNSIVFGVSPNIVIKEKSEKDIHDMLSHIWKDM